MLYTVHSYSALVHSYSALVHSAAVTVHWCTVQPLAHVNAVCCARGIAQPLHAHAARADGAAPRRRRRRRRRRYANATVGGEGRGVRPQMFKALVGKGHAEFSSARQQARRPAAPREPRLPSAPLQLLMRLEQCRTRDDVSERGSVEQVMP